MPNPSHPEWRRAGFVVSADPARLHIARIVPWLRTPWWGAQQSDERLRRMILRSPLVLGVYAEEAGEQVGFARVLTDFARLAWLSDVHIAEAHRGQGLGRWLIECALAHPDVQGLQRWILATGDGHAFYEPFGFRRLDDPAKFMVRDG